MLFPVQRGAKMPGSAQSVSPQSGTTWPFARSEQSLQTSSKEQSKSPKSQGIQTSIQTKLSWNLKDFAEADRMYSTRRVQHLFEYEQTFFSSLEGLTTLSGRGVQTPSPSYGVRHVPIGLF